MIEYALHLDAFKEFTTQSEGEMNKYMLIEKAINKGFLVYLDMDYIVIRRNQLGDGIKRQDIGEILEIEQNTLSLSDENKYKIDLNSPKNKMRVANILIDYLRQPDINQTKEKAALLELLYRPLEAFNQSLLLNKDDKESAVFLSKKIFEELKRYYEPVLKDGLSLKYLISSAVDYKIQDLARLHKKLNSNGRSYEAPATLKELFEYFIKLKYKYEESNLRKLYLTQKSNDRLHKAIGLSKELQQESIESISNDEQSKKKLEIKFSLTQEYSKLKEMISAKDATVSSKYKQTLYNEFYEKCKKEKDQKQIKLKELKDRINNGSEEYKQKLAKLVRLQKELRDKKQRKSLYPDE